jgi:cytochrome c-type biogenesis protein CcmF
MIGEVRDIYYMLYLLTAWFSVIGNSFIMYRLIRQKPLLIGGTLSHVGFGVLLLGILASSAYNENLLDESVRQYNQAIENGEVTDEQGFQVTQKVDFLELKLNEPKVIGEKYKVTYEGYTLKDQERPGQQQYRIRFESADGEGSQFVLNPQVYPMLSSSSASNIQWSVDPDVYTGLMSDIYLYVAGSSYVERRNEETKKNAQNRQTQPAAMGGQASSSEADSTSKKSQKVTIKRGETVSIGSFDLTFNGYSEISDQQLRDSMAVAIRAELEIKQRGSDSSAQLRPLFSVYSRDGKNWSYSPPTPIPGHDGSIRFTSVDPSQGGIELTIDGIDTNIQEQWVLLVAEEKPFISIVWLGTFLLMAGFSVSIFRHWDRERKKT